MAAQSHEAAIDVRPATVSVVDSEQKVDDRYFGGLGTGCRREIACRLGSGLVDDRSCDAAPDRILGNVDQPCFFSGLEWHERK